MKKIALLSLLAVCLVRSAHAGLFDDEEARRRIDAIKLQTDSNAQRLDTASRSQLELANNLENLRADLAKLRGQIEILANEQAQTNKRQQDFYVELDGRLRKLETAAAQPPKPVEPPPPDAAAESRDYEAAIAALRSGKNVDAALAFHLDSIGFDFEHGALKPLAEGEQRGAGCGCASMNTPEEASTSAASTAA